jgi:hypothetical protein
MQLHHTLLDKKEAKTEDQGHHYTVLVAPVITKAIRVDMRQILETEQNLIIKQMVLMTESQNFTNSMTKVVVKRILSCSERL